MSIKHTRILFWVVNMVLLSASAVAQDSIKPQRDPVPMPTVNQDTLLKFIRDLSSEQYEGRMAGTRGYDRAMEYVEEVLFSYGISDITEQQFGVECNEVENCKFNTYLPGSKDKRVYTLGREFCCAGMTGRGYIDAQMVFCSYGIASTVENDFEGVDVQGKIVVVLTGLPENNGLTQNDIELNYMLRDKARNAEKRGAIGLIAINTSTSCLPDAPQGRVYCGELPHLATFPMLHITLETAREMFAAEAMPIDSAIARIEREHKPQSFALTKKAEIDINARYRSAAATANVVGILPGSDKRYKKEYIVIGASLDGAGMQGETCLFPGADINASGVAAVLETARLLSQPEYRPKRSVVFVFFSASEQQYLGSRMFAQMFRKLRRVEAFIDVQNIGYGDSLLVLGDNHYPTLHNIATSHDTAVGRHNVMRYIEPTNPRGDARIFDAMRLPSLVITTYNGMHHNHVATDVWENIDRRMLCLGAQLATETVAELAEGLYVGRSPQSKGYRYGLIQY